MSGFLWDGDHVLFSAPGGLAVFTTRRGGVSSGPYDSLNLGPWTDDDADDVAENLRRAAALADGRHLAFAQQVHGTDVVMTSDDVATADGQVTAGDDAALVLVADCLPVVLIADGAVGAVHAGWRGLAGGVLEAGVDTLRSAGATGPITAAIGPGAGGCCYETGEEVHAVFASDDARVGERNLDLKAIARARLEAAGVDTVGDAGLCTLCHEPGVFFSHRRDGGITGRQAGIAWRR